MIVPRPVFVLLSKLAAASARLVSIVDTRYHRPRWFLKCRNLPLGKNSGRHPQSKKGRGLAARSNIQFHTRLFTVMAKLANSLLDRWSEGDLDKELMTYRIFNAADLRIHSEPTITNTYGDAHRKSGGADSQSRIQRANEAHRADCDRSIREQLEMS